MRSLYLGRSFCNFAVFGENYLSKEGFQKLSSVKIFVTEAFLV
jgi:hypothetical protein